MAQVVLLDALMKWLGLMSGVLLCSVLAKEADMGKNANKRKNQPQQNSKQRESVESKHNPWGNTGLAMKVGREQKQKEDLVMKDVEGGSVFESVRGKLTKGVVGQIVLVLVALGVLGAVAAKFFQ